MKIALEEQRFADIPDSQSNVTMLQQCIQGNDFTAVSGSRTNVSRIVHLRNESISK
jgi:hypothetical protein